MSEIVEKTIASLPSILTGAKSNTASRAFQTFIKNLGSLQTKYVSSFWLYAMWKKEELRSFVINQLLRSDHKDFVYTEYFYALRYQLGAAANFDNLVKFGDRRQIRPYQIFIKLAFEFGCDAILMSHPIPRSLGSKLRQT